MFILVTARRDIDGPEMQEKMRTAIKDIEGEFSEVLKEWDGATKKLKGAKRNIIPLLQSLKMNEKITFDDEL